MRARHLQCAGSAALRWVMVIAGLGLAGSILLALAPAGASAKTVDAQLALSGVTTPDNPTGGSVIGIHPGDSIDFTASAAPTAGLEKLGLKSLVSGLGTIISFKVTGDFSHLPGGKAGTTLSGKTDAKFSFKDKGTYNFTYSAKAVGLLGLPINLDGNQLKQAGVKLNASNDYIGKVVVADNPPKGGISGQLPGVKVAPSAPGVGQLPTVSIPGATLPTIHPPSLPNIGASKPSSGSGSDGHGKHHSGSKHQGSGSGSQRGLTVPEEIVPKGDTAVVIPGSGGYFPGVVPDAPVQISNAPQPVHNSAGKTVTSNAPSKQSKSASKAKAVDLSTTKTSPSSSIPIVLAIVAVIALTLVAATYARLFLVRR